LAIEQRRSSILQVRYSVDGSVTVSVEESLTTRMLFEAGALPEQPTPTARLRAGYGHFIAGSPRGTHTQVAAALGVSRQQLTNWKAGRYPLNAGAEATLSALLASNEGAAQPPVVTEEGDRA
jgi:hypothetical protein